MDSPYVKNPGAMYTTTMATPDVSVPVITLATSIDTPDIPMGSVDIFATQTDTSDVPTGIGTSSPPTDTPDGKKNRRGRRGGRRHRDHSNNGPASLRLAMAGYSSKPMDMQTTPKPQKRDREAVGLSPQPKEFLRIPPIGPKGWGPIESMEDYIPLSPSPETQGQAENMYMNITSGNSPLPTPAIDFAKETGLLNENMHDFAVLKENFKKAYIKYAYESDKRSNDPDVRQKFRIVHRINEALEEKGELALMDLKAVLEKIDRFEGPVSAGMSGNHGKGAVLATRAKLTDAVYTPAQIQASQHIPTLDEHRSEGKARQEEEARGVDDEPEPAAQNVRVAAEHSAKKKEAPQQLSKKERKKANKRARQEELERRLLQTRAEKRLEKQEKQRAAREVQEEQLRNRNKELPATDDSDLEHEGSGNATKGQRKSRRLKEIEKKRREEEARELLEGKEKLTLTHGNVHKLELQEQRLQRAVRDLQQAQKDTKKTNLSYGEMYEIEVAKVRGEMARQVRLQAEREVTEKVETRGAMYVDG